MAEAANQPAGQSLSYYEVQYGDVVVALECEDRFGWEVISNFADMMLQRVFRGEQNFYIANIVQSASGQVGFTGAFGERRISFMMATPETVTSIANQPWAATVTEWLRSKGLA